MSVAFRTYLLQTLTLPTNEPYPDLYQYGQDEALTPQNQAAPPAAPRAPQAAPTAPRRPVTANEGRDHPLPLPQQRGIDPPDVAARAAEIAGGNPHQHGSDAAPVHQRTA